MYFIYPLKTSYEPILLNKSAIKINENLKISIGQVPVIDKDKTTRAMYIDIMPETRNHANELKTVFNNAIFGTAHITAGVYFT